MFWVTYPMPGAYIPYVPTMARYICVSTENINLLFTKNIIYSKYFSVSDWQKSPSPRLIRQFNLWRLLLIYSVKCKRTLFEPNSKEPYSSSERKRKFSSRLFTSSKKREIWHFSRRRPRGSQSGRG